MYCSMRGGVLIIARRVYLAPVESLGSLVGSLPQLLVVGGLLHQVQDLKRKSEATINL